jgi:hypothetical protein
MTSQIDFLTSEIQNLEAANRNLRFLLMKMAQRVQGLEQATGILQAPAPEPALAPAPATDSFRQIDHCKAVYNGIEDDKAHLASYEEACVHALANGYTAFTHVNREGSNAYYYFKRNHSRLNLESSANNTHHTSWVMVEQSEVGPVAEPNPSVGQFRLIPNCRAINDTEDEKVCFGSDEEAFAHAHTNNFTTITRRNRIGPKEYTYYFKRDHSRLAMHSGNPYTNFTSWVLQE